MSILSPIAPYRVIAEIGIVAALCTWGGVQTDRLHGAQRALEQEQGARAVEKALASAAAASANTAYRTWEFTDATLRAKETKDATDKLAAATAGAAAASDAVGRLRVAFTAAVVAARRSPAADPAAAGASQAAPAGDLPAVMFDRTLGVAQQLAVIADQALTAGELCQAAWPAPIASAPLP